MLPQNEQSSQAERAESNQIEQFKKSYGWIGQEHGSIGGLLSQAERYINANHETGQPAGNVKDQRSVNYAANIHRQIAIALLDGGEHEQQQDHGA